MWMVQFMLFLPKPVKFYINATSATSIDTYIPTLSFTHIRTSHIHDVPAVITVNKHICAILFGIIYYSGDVEDDLHEKSSRD